MVRYGLHPNAPYNTTILNFFINQTGFLYEAAWNKISRIIERRWTQMDADKDGLIKECQDDVQLHIKLVLII